MTEGTMDVETGAKVRALRDSRNWTQAQLAEAAGLSTSVIKKVERGDNVRFDTLHAIARVFGLRTMTFVPAGAPEPAVWSRDESVFAPVRAALTPPADLRGNRIHIVTDDEQKESEEPSLQRLRAATDEFGAIYHTSRYGQLARLAPPLIRSAHHHVEALQGSPDEHEARRIRSDVLNLTARWLLQIRAHDLAFSAVTAALQDAVAINDPLLAAAALRVQGWAMIRQGRLDEVEKMCVQAADEITPDMRKATHEEFSAWGQLWWQASAAAARNNRLSEATEYADLVVISGSRAKREAGRPAGSRWGPLTAALIKTENAGIAGQPREVLEHFARLPRDVGATDPNDWSRARLDCARAHTELGEHREATSILVGLRTEVPEWLRHQQLGADVTRRLVTSVPQLTGQHRSLAKFFAISN